LIEACPSSAASHVRKALFLIEVTPLSSLETPHSREDLPRNLWDSTALRYSTCSGCTTLSSDPLEYTLKSIIGGTKYSPNISAACRFPVDIAFDTSLICGGDPAGALQPPALVTLWCSGWISSCAPIRERLSALTLEFSVAILPSTPLSRSPLGFSFGHGGMGRALLSPDLASHMASSLIFFKKPIIFVFFSPGT
jgi:hypothetical protein